MTEAVPYARSGGWSVALGILLLVAGFFALAMPLFVSIAASMFLGWVILFGGVAHLIYAWSERGAGAIGWEILIGLVYVAAALYLLFFPFRGILVLTLVLATYIAIEGVLELGAFFALRRMHGSTWFLIDGLVSLMLAGLIFFHWPSSSIWALGTIVGVSLMFSGIARLTLPAAVRLARSNRDAPGWNKAA